MCFQIKKGNFHLSASLGLAGFLVTVAFAGTSRGTTLPAPTGESGHYAQALHPARWCAVSSPLIRQILQPAEALPLWRAWKPALRHSNQKMSPVRRSS